MTIPTAITSMETRPYPTEHSCRLREPSDFNPKSIIRVPRNSASHNDKVYWVVRGRLKADDSWADQAYRYKIDVWTEAEARSHCKAHKGILFEPAEPGK